MPQHYVIGPRALDVSWGLIDLFFFSLLLFYLIVKNNRYLFAMKII